MLIDSSRSADARARARARAAKDQAGLASAKVKAKARVKSYRRKRSGTEENSGVHVATKKRMRTTSNDKGLLILFHVTFIFNLSRPCYCLIYFTTENIINSEDDETVVQEISSLSSSESPSATSVDRYHNIMMIL